MLKFLITAFLLINSFTLFAQAPSPPFNRGVNLTNWFQANSAQEIHFRKYSKTDFQNIKDLGFDVIRLPINLRGMTDGAPSYNIEPLFFNFLDSAVSWAEELHMHLILDNHTFSVTENTMPEDVDYLLKVWQQMAEHYNDRSSLIYYEILNEPHGISDEEWNHMQQQVIKKIREVDEDHTIIVGPAGWNSYNNLSAMPEYDDDNLIYTFHFYDPFIFTHQGASWVDPSMVPLQNIPFPYDQNEMPELDDSFDGTWIGSSFNNYQNEGTVAHVKELIDIAIEFRDNRNVPVYCGEFGVLMDYSDNDDRVEWYNLIQEYLEANDISWTMWDYHHGFGIFEKGSSGLFDHDLNVPLLEALDLNVPNQTPFEKKPETGSILIYDDFIGAEISNSSWHDGILNYFSNHQPNNDSYSIHWTQAEQYNNIAFDFSPDKDFSELVEDDYAVDLFVRGLDLPEEFSFDIRFLDSKTSAEDRPWRKRVTVTQSMVEFDGKWYHLHLPLKEFSEQGAWDEDWYNPEGLFDWSDIDRLEISNEFMPLDGGSLWFDNIFITNQDTAQVRNHSTVEGHSAPEDQENVTGIFNGNENKVMIYPNPSGSYINVQFLGTELANGEKLEIFDIRGNSVLKSSPHNENGFIIDCRSFSSGTYFLKSSKSGIIGRFTKTSIN